MNEVFLSFDRASQKVLIKAEQLELAVLMSFHSETEQELCNGNGVSVDLLVLRSGSVVSNGISINKTHTISSSCSSRCLNKLMQKLWCSEVFQSEQQRKRFSLSRRFRDRFTCWDIPNWSLAFNKTKQIKQIWLRAKGGISDAWCWNEAIYERRPLKGNNVCSF